MSTATRADESSLAYPGWRVVLGCFLMALFVFGFGLYGHGLYLAELQRLRGFPAVLIASASTLSFLLSSLLQIYVVDAMARLGARRLILLGMAALAASTTAMTLAVTPWQLYAAYILLAFAWSGMGTVVIATLLSGWFEHRRGLAISLAFNGGTCGGIVVAPALVLATGAIGFQHAMWIATALMLAVLLPVVALCIAPPPAPPAPVSTGDLDVKSRWQLLRSGHFWSVSAPFALALMAQIGFIVHQIAFLEPAMGRAQAGFTVSLTTAMALIGRLCLGVFVDRLDPRIAAACSMTSQAAALLTIIQASDPRVLIAACAVYGFSIGNNITLAPLIITREFSPAAFGIVLGLSTALGGLVSALGPTLVGLLRAATGDYVVPLLACMALKLAASAIVLLRRGALHPRARPV